MLLKYYGEGSTVLFMFEIIQLDWEPIEKFKCPEKIKQID